MQLVCYFTNFHVLVLAFLAAALVKIFFKINRCVLMPVVLSKETEVAAPGVHCA